MSPVASGSSAHGLDVRERDTPPPEWPDLIRGDPTATPAHRAEVAAAFAAVLPGYEARWFVVEEGGVAVGGAPACIERLAGLAWLHALPRVLPGAPVSRPGREADVDRAVARAIARWLESPGAAGGEWVCCRPPEAPPVRAVEDVPGETRTMEAAVVDLRPGPAALHARLARRERHELRRARDQGLRFAEDASLLDQVYALHEAQARGWRAHRPPPLALLRRLLEPSEPGAEPAARLLTVRGRRLLQGMLLLDHDHESLAWWSGTHPEARSVSAAHGLMWWAIEWAAARGRARLNLGGSGGLAGIASFKRALGAVERPYPVRWLEPPHPSPLVRAARALRRIGRVGHRGDAA